MMSHFIPLIGVGGLYNLLAPFDTVLLPNISYRCISVRRLADILAAGGDPFAEYYQPKGLSESVFTADVEIGVCIVSLQAEQHVVYVPSTYINGYPDIGGVPYTTLALAINLGAVPDKMDLTYVKSRIAAVVLENIGIDSVVTTMAVSLPTLLNATNADVIEAARLAKITAVQTDRAKLLETERLLDAARQHIVELENYLRTLNPSVP
jgi:hypothetical protein